MALLKEEAQDKVSKRDRVHVGYVMFLKEDKEAFYFMFKKNMEYFKTAVSKKEDEFYSMTDTLTREEIISYDNFMNDYN